MSKEKIHKRLQKDFYKKASKKAKRGKIKTYENPKNLVVIEVKGNGPHRLIKNQSSRRGSTGPKREISLPVGPPVDPFLVLRRRSA